ncbi:hypothetical protein MKW98_026505 [Papaver atlanticum]|uniref:phosphopyruvate hydratase n=1 Tax=Papaver atlanticum TaxID=357466 RepID=A0AAD4T9E3_9MAGN|nr:hypothetical protein MKW98_026505 [Papaver atlanticum]
MFLRFEDGYCEDTYGDFILQQRQSIVNWMIDESGPRELNLETMLLCLLMVLSESRKSGVGDGGQSQVSCSSCCATGHQLLLPVWSFFQLHFLKNIQHLHLHFLKIFSLQGVYEMKENEDSWSLHLELDLKFVHKLLMYAVMDLHTSGNWQVCWDWRLNTSVRLMFMLFLKLCVSIYTTLSLSVFSPCCLVESHVIWLSTTCRYTAECGDKVQIVGDNLLVTSPKRVEKAIKEKSCNALLLKVNLIGSVTESIEAVRMSKKVGWGIMTSHRSGETEDTFIADLAVGLATGQMT